MNKKYVPLHMLLNHWIKPKTKTTIKWWKKHLFNVLLLIWYIFQPCWLYAKADPNLFFHLCAKFIRIDYEMALFRKASSALRSKMLELKVHNTFFVSVFLFVRIWLPYFERIHLYVIWELISRIPYEVRWNPRKKRKKKLSHKTEFL